MLKTLNSYIHTIKTNIKCNYKNKDYDMRKTNKVSNLNSNITFNGDKFKI